MPGFTARILPLAVKIAGDDALGGRRRGRRRVQRGRPGGLTNTNKEWWPQAEAVVGFINAYQVSGQERYLRAAFRTWDFIERRLVDSPRRRVVPGRHARGRVLDNELKVSFWKCPYHNGRTGLEAAQAPPRPNSGRPQARPPPT
jgi:cellobiose epimerase